MKYKLYAITDKNNPYYGEIRGVRFDYQYHLLPVNAEYVKKEYDVEKDGSPQLFFKEDGRNINFVKYKVNEDLTDIVEITRQELESNPRYIKEQQKKILAEELRISNYNSAINTKISDLNRLRKEKPQLSKAIDNEISELQGKLL